MLMIGLPAALSTTLAMVSNIFANNLIRPYGSEAVAGMGVAKKINMIASNTCMGMTTAILPSLDHEKGNRRHSFHVRVPQLFGCARRVLGDAVRGGGER